MRNRILCFCLALLMLLPLITACGGDQTALEIVKDGKSDYVILYPDRDKEAQEIANSLSAAIGQLTGVLLRVQSDIQDEQEKEILVGYTNREASNEVLEGIRAQGDTFAIAAQGERLVLTATGDALFYGCELLQTSVEALGGSCREGYLALPRSLFHTSTAKLPDSFASLIASTAQLELKKEGATVTLSEIAESERLCALTTDGSNHYVATKIPGEEQVLLHQFSVGGVLNATSQKLELGMATSLCYDSLTDTLVVTHGGSGEDARRLYLIDPGTLTLRRTVELDYAVSAISYIAAENRYLVKLRDENTCYLLDGSFRQSGEPIALPRVLASDAIKDVTADARYIYFLQNNGSIMLVDRRSTRYQTLPLPFDQSTIKSVSLCIRQKSFLVGVICSPVDKDEKDSIQLLTATPKQTEKDATPADLFTEEMRAEVDISGLANTKMFDTYTKAGSPAKNTVMQGGCTDGKYAYICMENQAGNYSNTYLHDTRIVKVELATKKLAAVSEPLKLHHSNDMCYNALTGQLIVLHNGKEANVISFVDPDTLTVIGTQILPMGVYSIAHEPTTDRYVVGKSGGRNYAILDGNFNVLVRHLDAGPYTHYTDTNPVTQGIDCDETYIYSVLGVKYTETVDGTSKTLWRNFLVVHNWRGDYLFAKILPNMTVESENVFHVGNTIYVGCNGGNDPVYRFDIVVSE